MFALLRLLPAFLLLVSLSAAAAPGEVARVRLESHPDRLDFYFTASSAIDGSLAEAIPARAGEVLILRLGGITAERRWITFDDPAIFRALLHPSTDRPPGAILRLRFVRAGLIGEDLARQIKAEYVGDDRTVRISVPRPRGAPKPKAAKAAPEPMRMPPAVLGPGGDGPPVEAPKPPVEAPKPPIEAPKPPVEAPKPPVERPKPPVETPKPPVETPKPPAEPPKPPAALKPPPETPTPPPAERPRPPDTGTLTPTPTPAASTAAPTAATGPPLRAIILPPDPITADIPAGIDAFVARLRVGVQQRPGTPRVALLPFTALDAASRDAHFGGATAALVGARLVDGPGLVLVDSDHFAARLDALHRDADGRFALDDARAVAAMLGADTVIAGSVEQGPAGVVLMGRAIDAETGEDLGQTEQAFVAAALRETTNAMREERTVGGSVARSLVVPGWGQIHQGHVGRGAAYLAGFAAVLGAGVVSSVLGEGASGADADEHQGRATALYIGAGAVWLASLVDAIITSEHQVRYRVPGDEER